MKRFLFLITIFISCLSSLKASTFEPKLTLNIYYVDPSDTLFLQGIRKSDETCCKYEFITIKSNKSKIEVCSRDQILGTIFGYPTDKFLLDIYDRFYKSK